MSVDLQEKAINLYEYFANVVRLRTHVVYDANDYIECIWIDDIPHAKECYCRAWDVDSEEEDEVWVEIKRPKMPQMPQVPSECEPWVDGKSLKEFSEGPKIREEIYRDKTSENGDLFTEVLRLEDIPNIKNLWETYVNDKWKPWSEEYLRMAKVQDIYGKLFAMYQQQKALGESYEVIVGLGVLKYKNEKGKEIKRHIISAQTELLFEPNKGSIVVKSSPTGAILCFETEMIDPKEFPDIEIQIKLSEKLAEISNDLWNNPEMYAVIRTWAQAFKADAEYSDSMAAPKDNKGNPQVYFAPAIILRKRANRGVLGFIENIKKQIKKNGLIPPNIKGVLEIAEDVISKEGSVEDAFGEEKEERGSFVEPKVPLLPLPINDEQKKIIEKIGKKRGVIVQGPPGTGKSHTIANIICHLLSQGKRVLVTSQTSRALKVLQQKIPKELKPLCVSVLGNRHEDLDSLQNAVNEISRRHSSWDKNSVQQRISKLEKNLDDLKQKKQCIDVSLRELREKETIKFNIIDNKFSGTAESIARQLKETEKELGWIEDEISSDQTPPLTNEEFSHLLKLQAKITEDKSKELSKTRVSSSEIFSPEEFVEMIEKEKKYNQIDNDMSKNIELRLLYDQLKKNEVSKREKLLKALRELSKGISEAKRRPLPWLDKAVDAILGDQDQPLKELKDVTEKYLFIAKEKAVNADDANLKFPDGIDRFKLKADAEDLKEHLMNNKGLGWACFRPKIYKKVKYLLKEVYVNGRACDNIDSLVKLIDCITVEAVINKLQEAWKDKIEISNGTKFHQTAVFEEQLEALGEVLKLEEFLFKAKQVISELENINPPSWHEPQQIKNLLEALEATFVIDKRNYIEEKYENVSRFLKAESTKIDSHQVNKELLNALENGDWEKWGNQYNLLLNLEKQEKQQRDLIGLLKKLQNKSEILVKSIIEDPQDDLWKKPHLNFEAAWDWLRADAWLREFEETHDEYQLQQEYTDVQNKTSKAIAELAALKSWFHCFSKMTEHERQHLKAWSVAIQRLGKGTGKRAEIHRRNAREHMNECRGAIPGWIMPLYRVVDTIEPNPEIFDVVIIDEASQCGPEALFLFYLAKQCIVVGDDQQISPEGVGVDRSNVDILMEKYLKDIPHRDSFAPENSLFTQAEIRFGARIVLREHFRCVPEIIQFSNDLCYAPLGYSLIPLREYSPERLEPIKVKYFREGYREGKGQYAINKVEARAIAEQIRECCKDSNYKNKTMGVISLQGGNQARYIENLLVDAIGPEEMEKRSLVCGDAYDFQGDERDVMFLSLVAAPSETTRIGVLAKNSDKRRFNVAVSRARDQVWLFHSVTLNDLSPACQRYYLLNYCLHPGRVQQDIDEDIFDSDFERKVYCKIKEKEYKVIPHYKAANFEIDLVVEGVDRRLAVECDGEYWHGPEQFEHDMRRQRILERAGWTFWRLSGSSFYRDEEQALDPLWQKLESMGIKSNTALDSRKKIIEEREEEVKLEDNTLQETIEKKETKINIIQEELFKDADERLSKAISWGKKVAQRKGVLKPDLIRRTIIGLLQQSTQGDDLIADNVLRALEIKNRGRERLKLKRKVKRVLSDMKREGVVEEYSTEKRKRIKLSDSQNFKSNEFL